MEKKLLLLLLLNVIIIDIIHTQMIKTEFHIEDYSPKKSHLRNLGIKEIKPLRTNNETGTRTIVNLCFGFPPQCIDLVIHTNSFYVWVYDRTVVETKAKQKLNIYESESLERNPKATIQLDYNDNQVKVKGYHAADTFWVGHTQVKNFNFALITESDFTKIDGMMGLGFTPLLSEEPYSFIHQLHAQGYITNRIFTQTFTSDTIGLIYIGEVPHEISQNPGKTGYCSALDIYKNNNYYRNRNWECELTGMFLGKEYNVQKLHTFSNQRLSFLSYRKKTIVPHYIYQLLEATFFETALQKSKCEKYKTTKHESFKCSEIPDEITDLNLLFGQWGIKLLPNELFEKIDEGYKFIFSRKDTVDSWVLGRSVLRHFHIVYDNENEKIGFYGNEYNNVMFIGNNMNNVGDDGVKKSISSNNYTGKLERKDKKKFSSSFIARVAFWFVLFIIGITVLISGFIIFRKYRRKHIHPSHDYLYQKAASITEQK